jgi:hypothetical protein
VQDGALDHALEPGRGLGIGLFLRFQRLVFLIEVLAHHVAQVTQVDSARLHYLRRIGIVDQGQQEVLERRVFVAALRGVGERGVRVFSRLWAKLGIGSYFLACAGLSPFFKNARTWLTGPNQPRKGHRKSA